MASASYNNDELILRPSYSRTTQFSWYQIHQINQSFTVITISLVILLPFNIIHFLQQPAFEIKACHYKTHLA